MLTIIKNKLKSFAEQGLYLPLAYDNHTKTGSATLLFAYGSFIAALCSVGYLSYKDPTQGAWAAIGLAIVYNVLYRLKQVDKFKLSLEEKTIELEDTPDVNKDV